MEVVLDSHIPYLLRVQVFLSSWFIKVKVQSGWQNDNKVTERQLKRVEDLLEGDIISNNDHPGVCWNAYIKAKKVIGWVNNEYAKSGYEKGENAPQLELVGVFNYDDVIELSFGDYTAYVEYTATREKETDDKLGDKEKEGLKVKIENIINITLEQENISSFNEVVSQGKMDKLDACVKAELEAMEEDLELLYLCTNIDIQSSRSNLKISVESVPLELFRGGLISKIREELDANDEQVSEDQLVNYIKTKVYPEQRKKTIEMILTALTQRYPTIDIVELRSYATELVTERMEGEQYDENFRSNWNHEDTARLLTHFGDEYKIKIEVMLIITELDKSGHLIPTMKASELNTRINRKQFDKLDELVKEFQLLSYFTDSHIRAILRRAGPNAWVYSTL